MDCSFLLCLLEKKHAVVLLTQFETLFIEMDMPTTTEHMPVTETTEGENQGNYVKILQLSLTKASKWF